MPEIPEEQLKRYQDREAELTRAQQELAEIRRQRENSELVETAALAGLFSRTDPESKAKWSEWADHLGLPPEALQRIEAGGNVASQTTGTERPGDALSQADEADLLDPESRVYKQLEREFGHRGIRDEILRRMSPQILQAAGIPDELAALRQRAEEQDAIIAELREGRNEDRQYLQSVWHEHQKLVDPMVAEADKLAHAMHEDPKKLLEVAKQLKELQELKAARGSPVAPPERVASDIARAEGTPGGAGPTDADTPRASRPRDPFGEAVRIANLKHPSLAAR